MFLLLFPLVCVSFASVFGLTFSSAKSQMWYEEKTIRDGIFFFVCRTRETISLLGVITRIRKELAEILVCFVLWTCRNCCKSCFIGVYFFSLLCPPLFRLFVCTSFLLSGCLTYRGFAKKTAESIEFENFESVNIELRNESGQVSKSLGSSIQCILLSIVGHLEFLRKLRNYYTFTLGDIVWYKESSL